MRQPKHARAGADRVEPGSDHPRDVLPAALLGGGRLSRRPPTPSSISTRTRSEPTGSKRPCRTCRRAAQNLTTAAKEQFGPQVAELEKAIASLRATLAGLSDQDSLSTNLGKIAASVGAVEQAARPIVDSVRTGCPAVPPAELPAS